jgi:phosphoserine phosphatase RsbU/P
VTYCGAGEHLFIVSRHGQSHYRLETTGVPLGCSTDLEYDPAVQVPLAPGDILLLLTDGFREAHNSNNELFGEDCIINVVAAHQHESASDIFNSMRNAIQEFTGDMQQHDDMTGIVVKVLND